MSDRNTHAAIEPLDAATVERIAAGEVVERPASVVKELVENSLDAGATRIGVAVENGGKDGIRVRDNGAGIPASELSIAVEPHTTSKIDAIDDLESGIGTLGFRGEALSTIAAVSKLTLRSKPHDESVGAQLTVEGGDAGEVRPAGCPAGTTVEVSALFYNTPARKKFLKRDATEFDHVNTVLTQYALANPDVAVSLEHNDRELFATSGSGDLRAAVLSVYGRDVAESMLDLEATFEEGPIDRIYGLVSDPETTRSNRQYLATFVNDRYVTDSVLRDAVIDAYGGQLAADRYPFAVLFVELPPETVDVNVHPRKLEVRFDDEPAVERSVRDAVSRTLVDEGLIRSSAPRGRSAPAETQISPEWSIDGSNGQPRDESNAKPIDESNAKPTDESNAKPTDESNAKPTDESNAKPTDESNAKPTDESNAK
ncbi:MAG: DNA mismatch repair endonuclease MutL, partial [Halobacteriota archaeon]